jgi:glycosyltransferase involved in cell wall biosynthesis
LNGYQLITEILIVEMKIALVSQEYPPETARGGIGTQTFAKAVGLSNLGHQVFVISRSIDLNRHEISNNGINVIRIPGMEQQMSEMTDAVQWLTHSMAVAIEIETLHKRVGLDIIDFPEWAAEGYIHLLNRTDWNKIPVVIQLHGPLVMFAHTMNWPETNSEFYRVGTHMESTCIQLADVVYSSSRCSTEWIKKYYDSQKKDIPTIHLGIDTQLFSPQAVEKHTRPTILFIGKIVKNKGVEELVDAACQLMKEIPDLRLRMIGHGDEQLIQKLRNKAMQYGATDLLDFAGFINKNKLPEEISRDHVFAAPSYYEGGPGFVYLEAMSCGLPVIGCSGSGVDEIIHTGENGMLVSPKDVDGLTQALRKILSDENFSKNMGIKAREFVLKEANSLDCLKRLEHFYNSVIESNSSKITSMQNDRAEYQIQNT